MFLNVFNPVQALLLSSLRVLRPQSGRSQSAEQPRKVVDSGPQTRQVREHGQAEIRPKLRLTRVRKLSAVASSPRQQAREQSVHVLSSDAASTGHEPAVTRNMDTPQTDRDSELAAATVATLTGVERGNEQAKRCPIRCIAVAILPPISFPVCIHHNSAYVLL